MRTWYALWFGGWSFYFATAGDPRTSYVLFGIGFVFGAIRRA